jgi:membrane-associated phospholipid phosphatase
MRPGTGWLVPWLLVVAAGQVAAVEVLRRVFLGTIRGQLLDTAALDGNSIGQSYVEGLVDTVLSAMTVVSLAAATIAIGFIALIRGRVLLAAATTLLIVGANLTTQVVKQLVERPDYGVDLARAAAGNSLPSGHTTVAASVAVALVMVLPAQLRAGAAVVGAGYAALAGVATLSAGWHRPSDAVASLLIVGAWAALAGLLLAVAHRREDTDPARPHRVAVLALFAAAVVLLAGATVAMLLTDRSITTQGELFWGAEGRRSAALGENLGRGRLLTAYAGGAIGIAGTASLVMALVLATVHMVVPERGQVSRSGRPAGSAAARRGAPVRAR